MDRDGALHAGEHVMHAVMHASSELGTWLREAGARLAFFPLLLSPRERLLFFLVLDFCTVTDLLHNGKLPVIQPR